MIFLYQTWSDDIEVSNADNRLIKQQSDEMYLFRTQEINTKLLTFNSSVYFNDRQTPLP